MAELMVSSSTGAMNSLLGKLATLMGDEFARLKSLRKEVKFIKDELTGMKDALEELSYLEELDPQTKRWRDIVRELSYDIEDIVDDFMENIGESKKTTGFVSNTIDRLKSLRVRHKIVGQIGEIKALVLETSARLQRYKLDAHPPSNVVIDPRVATLYENAANLVGLEAPTNDLVNLLADEDKQLKVVSIVGFGGLGKTTLANVVYGRVKGKFDQAAFVPVSQQPDIPKLLHSLLSQLGGETTHNSELNVLLDELRKYLHNKRYVIVIDDIWDVQAWGIIKCAFPENNLGSRVIVTTRICDVAKACCLHGSDHILEMKPLSNEDSRRLFVDRIFGSDEACPLHLREILDEILKRCGGLPLAIVSISSMLASEGSNQKERWEYVIDSLGSATHITLERMRQILNLSYKDLPPRLRTCFLYLGMYPEDYKVNRFNLERQWISEGFISKQNEQDAEIVARSYFNELVNRSLIQAVDFDNQGSVTSCRVHDMMLDLILIKSAEENFFTIVDDPRAITGLDYKIRRLSIRMEGHVDRLLPANINMPQVRTIMLFGSCSGTISLSEFKFLRVFFSDVNRYNGVLHARVCKLNHLRYLRSSRSIFLELPSQASFPKHLETLELYDRQRVPFTPDDSELTLLANGVGNIKSLQDLSAFDLLENTLDNIKGLGELVNLRYLVLVWHSSLEDMKIRMDAICSSLGRLGSLQDLLVVGSGTGEIDGMFPLSPPYRLQTLRTTICSFSRIPSWMGECRYLTVLQCRVSKLLRDGVRFLADLPVLGVLDIDNSNGFGGMIVFSGNAFPALKLFKIEFDISEISCLAFQPGAMPKLAKFELKFHNIKPEQYVVTPAGLEHLLALKEILLCGWNKEAKDITSVESQYRSVVNMHHANPPLVFSRDD